MRLYGQLNARPLAEHPASKRRFLDEPYPGGESWRQAVSRVGGFLADLPSRWAGKRVLVIGHVATRWVSITT
jgi:broad specificity phosphatase PhoE